MLPRKKASSTLVVRSWRGGGGTPKAACHVSSDASSSCPKETGTSRTASAKRAGGPCGWQS